MSALPYEEEAISFANGAPGAAWVNVTKTVTSHDKIPMEVIPNNAVELAKIDEDFILKSYDPATFMWTFSAYILGSQTAVCKIRWLKLHSLVKGGF